MSRFRLPVASRNLCRANCHRAAAGISRRALPPISRCGFFESTPERSKYGRQVARWMFLRAIRLHERSADAPREPDRCGDHPRSKLRARPAVSARRDARRLPGRSRAAGSARIRRTLVASSGKRRIS
ncbi:hypothetical protein [Burkholderia thailandensis]|uniref:hypothetical protein n=1 Tax=Burkholderia thailandensis TaxID=57975 RepID=UPI0021661F18|nr:hypothetical protein [Burkholderia thailandensis]MCS3391231.1 hypothetical protein [Burkholderia thailandensis]MCS6463619.1 hypothetical protein [Burkholderia thailandensis]